MVVLYTRVIRNEKLNKDEWRKNEMKKRMGILLSVLALGVFATGCAPKEKSQRSKKDNEVVRLGVMPSTDNIPFLVAQKEKLDQDNGVTIELEVFKSGQDRDAAFQAGQVDGVISDLVGLALYKQGGMAVHTVAAPYDEFDLVTADPKVETVADLKGKSVDFSELTGTAYAVDMMLQDAGLSLKDIKTENIAQVPTRLERLGANQTAGAILPEPFVTIGQAKGMKVIKTTQDLGINPFAIIFSDDFIAEHQAGIKNMITAYNNASKAIKEEPKEDILELFINDVGFPIETKDNIKIPDFGTMAAVKEKDVTSVLNWSHDNGILKEKLTAKEVMNNDFIK